MAKNNHKHALPGPDDIFRTELKNGITVLVRENFTAPSVIVDGILRGGGLLVPRKKAGLAAFHADLMPHGTKKHTFASLFEQVEGIGASLDVSAGGHTYSFSSKSLAEDLPLMLKLLAEVLREPVFPEDHVERVRGEIMTGLQARAHNTRQTASLTFHELAYPGDHPYGRSMHGYLDTVKKISREDILAFQNNLGPKGAIIVIVGAVKAADAVALVEKVFGNWKNPDQPPTPVAPSAPPLEGIQRKFMPIAGKAQADIIMGNPGPARTAPDYQAARMANSILGVFGLYGRLGDAVREKQGLAYYSYSQLEGGFGPGAWRVSAGVDPVNVDRAVDTIREELRRITQEPVTPEELSDNKSFFKGQLVIGLETNEGVAGSIMNMEKFGLGLDYLQRYSGMIDALDAEEVQAAAAHYLNPDSFALAIAGPDTAKSTKEVSRNKSAL